jgi:hypothetical protein
VIPFRPDTAADGSVRARFEPEEVDLLLRLAAEAAELAASAAALPEEEALADPALVRLLPDAYPGDPEKSAEFRRFTADGIAERKALNARTVVESLARPDDGPVEARLDPAQATAWLRCITDIRLILAARLDIVQDGDVGDLSDERAVFQRAVYEWLAEVQDSLVVALEDAAQTR